MNCAKTGGLNPAITSSTGPYLTGQLGPGQIFYNSTLGYWGVVNQCGDLQPLMVSPFPMIVQVTSLGSAEIVKIHNVPKGWAASYGSLGATDKVCAVTITGSDGAQMTGVVQVVRG